MWKYSGQQRNDDLYKNISDAMNDRHMDKHENNAGKNLKD